MKKNNTIGGGMEPNTGVREDQLIENMKNNALGRSSNTNNNNSGGLNNFSNNNNSNNNKNNNELKTGSQLAAETNANLIRALRVSEATNETGYATIQQLGKQKESIERTMIGVDDTRDELRDARRVIRDIRLSVYKEWAIKGIVLAILLLLDIILFYAKFIRRR